ncbi:hypothetical protein BGZ68_010848 [Mortierella alpina]|nr:hypothetical protein BGZ68_010848 [Mortierella alpina]
MQLRRIGSSSGAACRTGLAVLAALGLAQAQLPSLPSSLPPVETTTTTTTTTTTFTTTTTTTTVVPTVNPPSSSAPVPTSASPVPTSAPTTAPTYSPPPPPLSSTAQRTSTSIVPTATGAPPVSTPSNVPVIVGSVVGVVAVVIIVATTIICLRRRRRNNSGLTFDTLEGISTSGNANHPRNSQRYTANALPPVGRASNINGGYDDGYDEYDLQSDLGPAGYGSQAAPHQGYGEQHLGYDAYGTPLQGYQNPSIFQEDSLAYSTAANVGRQRAGFDHTLPEIVYRNGNDINHPAGGATGYYEDDMYNHQAGWNQNMTGGYIGPKGLWVANPTSDLQYQQQPHQDADIELVLQQQHLPQEPLSYERHSMNQYENMSETVVGSAGSPQSKFLGHNPQALPESPRLQQLRGGDLFGQDGEAAAAASPSPRAAHAQPGSPRNPESANTSTSPRLASREDMKSFESVRNSPPRPSTEGLQSYANDLTPPRPSTGERPSMDSNPSNLNPNKSLRTLRREDWG